MEIAATIFERHRREQIPPAVLLGKGHRPQLIGRGEMRHLAFLARLHVDAVNPLTIGGKGKADRQFVRIGLGLRHAFRHRFVEGLGLGDGELQIAIDQNVVRDLRRATPTAPLDATGADAVFPQDAAALHHTPTRRLEGGINVLSSGFGFVHEGRRV